MAQVGPFHRQGQSGPLRPTLQGGEAGLSAQGSPQTEIPGHLEDLLLPLMDMTQASESPAHVETLMCLLRVPPAGSS